MNENGQIEERELPLPTTSRNQDSFIINKKQSVEKSNEELLLHDLNVNEKGIEMALSGEPAKMFMFLLIQFFKENGGENYLTMEFQDTENKYEVTIVNQNGNDTPSAKLGRQEAIIRKYQEALQAIIELDDKHIKEAILIAKEALKSN